MPRQVNGSSDTNGRVDKSSTQQPAHQSLAWAACNLALAVAVIYSAYLTQGRVQELLAKSQYGLKHATFDRMEALVGAQCIACFLWAGLLQLCMPGTAAAQGGRPAPQRYAFMGATNVIGPACGMYALKKISYPAQVLAKSCKSVPIMLTGALLYRKRYKASEYASVLAIGLGVALFALASVKSKGPAVDKDPLLGYSLVLANLLLDSLTNTAQDELKRKYPQVSSLHMMCWTNFWGALFYSIAFFGVSSIGGEVVQFCMQHSEAMWHLLAFCLCGAIGQLGIFYAVASFGTLVTSIVCTTRKFFSILLSVLLAGTALSVEQSAAVALVFAGLLGKSVLSLAKGKPKKS